MRHDPHRVKKDEFLHELFKMHEAHPVGDLDLGDLTAAKTLATQAMSREDVVLTVGETADLMGEMAHAVGGKTKKGAQELAAKLDYAKRSKQAGKYQARKMAMAKEMLSRKRG